MLDFLSRRFVDWCEWGVQGSCYYCILINFSLYVCQHLFHVCGCSYIRCIYVDKCTIFLYWSFHHYLVSFYIFQYNLCFKVYFVWYEYCCLRFLVISWNIYFCPLTFSLCVSFALMQVSYKQHIVCSYYFYSVCSFVSFVCLVLWDLR